MGVTKTRGASRREATGGHAGVAEPGAREGAGLAPADFDAQDPAALLARVTAFVSRHVARLIEGADRRGGRLDKAQLDGLVTLARMTERFETLAAERARQDQTRRDDDFAATLAEINQHILAIASAEAERLFALRLAGDGQAAEVGMDQPGARPAISAVADVS